MPKKLFFIYQLYTLIAATILFLANLLQIPGPIRTANLIIIIPLVILAWINFTQPHKTSETIWSLRLLITVSIFSLLGLFTYQLAQPKTPAAPECPICSTIAPSPSPILPNNSVAPIATDSANFILGSIVIASQSSAKIYAEPNLNTQIIGIADYNNIFPYLEFNNGFFKIIFNSTQFGWVSLEAVIPSP